MDFEDQLDNMEEAAEDLEVRKCQGNAEYVKLCKHHKAVMMSLK